MGQIDRIISTTQLAIYHGDAIHWPGTEKIDLVFTNPYGPLPASLANHPMVIHQWVHRKPEAERWCYNSLLNTVGSWNDNREAFWSANLPNVAVNINEFKPESGGWYPEKMVRRLLIALASPGQTIWDGFMGRGTVGKIARELKMNYVGVERLSAHVALALDYLEIPK